MKFFSLNRSIYLKRKKNNKTRTSSIICLMIQQTYFFDRFEKYSVNDNALRLSHVKQI